MLINKQVLLSEPQIYFEKNASRNQLKFAKITHGQCLPQAVGAALWVIKGKKVVLRAPMGCWGGDGSHTREVEQSIIGPREPSA